MEFARARKFAAAGRGAPPAAPAANSLSRRGGMVVDPSEGPTNHFSNQKIFLAFNNLRPIKNLYNKAVVTLKRELLFTRVLLIKVM